MDYRNYYYSNRNAIDKSNRYKKKRIFWLNSSFNSDFVLIDNKIYEISWDIPPFEIYKNNRLKLLTYIRDSNQSKPIQIKLKLPLTQSRDIINTDKEAFPIIYTNHTGVEMMTSAFNPIIRLIPQQITRFTFRVDDNFNQLDYNSYFSSITNGSVFQVAGGSPDDKYIVFKSSGSFVLDKNLNCDILIVGGGGGGAARHGGGGGAGAVIYLFNQNLNSGTYTITVGAGGLKSGNSSGGQYGQNGGDSSVVLSGITIYLAKGGGGACVGLLAGGDGLAGGSGGGGTGDAGGGDGIGGNVSTGGTAVNTNIPSGVYGNSGGSGYGGAGSGNQWSGGGGGGAGAAGGNVTIGSGGTATGGAGGIGRQIAITGINNYYGGGGGGGVSEAATAAGTGGLGGGGNGGKGYGTGSNGTANTGGGGGGGGWGFSTGDSSSNGGDGGSGVVIIRFKEIRNEGITAEENLIQATNNSITVNTDSKYVINYQNPVNIPKGTYQSIFANGAITFKPKPDYSYPILNTNPIAWYKFDDNNLLKDEMNTYNLTNNNTSINNTNFIRGNASASFNGNGNNLVINNLDINNKSFSISCWLYLTDNTKICGIFGLKTTGSNGTTRNLLHIQYVPPIYGIGIAFNLFGDDLAYTGITTTTETNIWHHYVFVFNNDTNPKTTTIYRDGVQVATKNLSGGYSGFNNTYTIGQIFDDAAKSWAGQIDDFRIYQNKVLSPVEVYDLYNGNTDRSYPILKDTNNITINPLVWYQFDTSGNLGSDSMGIHNLTNPNDVAFSNDYVKGNGSAFFDGTNDFLEKTNAFNLNNKNFSISLWIKKSRNNVDDLFFSIGGDSQVNSTHLHVAYLPSNAISLRFWGFNISSTNTFTDAGIWVHLVFTFNTTTVVGEIYRNGVLIGSGNIGSQLNTNNVFRIGRSTTFYYQGLMDDFRIYESVLTATQVSELYNGRVSIYNPPAFLTGFELEDEDLFKENTISSYK